jgi:hypothetical protein
MAVEIVHTPAGVMKAAALIFEEPVYGRMFADGFDEFKGRVIGMSGQESDFDLLMRVVKDLTVPLRCQ